MILWVAPQPHNMHKLTRNTAVCVKDMIIPYRNRAGQSKHKLEGKSMSIPDNCLSKGGDGQYEFFFKKIRLTLESDDKKSQKKECFAV